MNNLTTRKIVLGLLMTLVLAFSVQGIADALNITPNAAPDDLSTRDIRGVIQVTGINGASPDVPNVRESVSISVSGGGANFPRPGDPNNTLVSSYTWTEGTPEQNQDNGAFDPAPSNVDITVVARE